MTPQGRVGLLPAAFNPPTLAHLGLAEAAQRQMQLGEVVFVLPRVLPHKEFDGVGFAQRLALLQCAVEAEPSWRAAASSGGLFLEIARELRTEYAPEVELYLICGADAGERIVEWDYGAQPSIAEQLEEFQMLVAARRGGYAPPPALAGRIRSIELDENLQAISSSQVRDAIAGGQPWRHLVPECVAAEIEAKRLYRDAS
ncbi:MAG: nicotinate-nicotinamide nucleotide adenylyltransferase [Acidobacteria bacterium]|nr:nicotinate-nicotinamide nucleotide adenylyltransferase [Acidobacteriota bacterium]